MTIYHVHHIIPRHAGGTNHPSNLIQLTVEDHAIAHRHLWKLYGRWQDKLAWLMLSGQIDNQEANRIRNIENGKATKGRIRSKETRQKMSLAQAKTTSCIFCKKQSKPSVILKGHILCYQKFYGLPSTPNSSKFDTNTGKKMAIKNNAKSQCPKCKKIGQYRAMKRWHFDNCKNLQTNSN